MNSKEIFGKESPFSHAVYIFTFPARDGREKITTETHLVTWKNQADSKTLIHKDPVF